MNKTKKRVIWAGVFSFLVIAGSLLHAPHWVASAAGIFSQPVSNVREANRRPYSAVFNQPTGSCQPTDIICTVQIATDVPAGYQLVITHVSASAIMGNSVASMSAQLGSANAPFVIFFALIPGGKDDPATQHFVGSQNVTLVVPPGPGIALTLLGQAGVSNFASDLPVVGVTGYLESCAAYPGGVCPSLAF